MYSKAYVYNNVFVVRTIFDGKPEIVENRQFMRIFIIITMETTMDVILL